MSSNVHGNLTTQTLRNKLVSSPGRQVHEMKRFNNEIILFANDRYQMWCMHAHKISLPSPSTVARATAMHKPVLSQLDMLFRNQEEATLVHNGTHVLIITNSKTKKTHRASNC